MKLEVKNLYCGYNKNTPILKNVNMTVETGDICTILGPNGVGKSTLFKTILNMVKPLSGNVRIDGEDTAKWSSRKLASCLGYVSQFHVPPFPYKVKDVVMLGRINNTGYFGQPSAMDYEITEAAMIDMGIIHLRDMPYTSISGGERQLVLIARVLAQEPKILVMDEPTSNLDYGNTIRVINKIRALRDKGYGIIMTTHAPDHAFMCEAKVALIRRHQEIAFGRCEEIVTERNLRDAYGINAKIIEFVDQYGRLVRMCSPLLD